MESRTGSSPVHPVTDWNAPSSCPVHFTVLETLRSWKVFESASENKLGQVRAFYSFNVPSHMGCSGGPGFIFLTARDEAFGVGHNCSNINILGFSKAHPAYRSEEISKPLRIPGLSGKTLMQMSVGGLIAAAVAECGTLFWWGLCYNLEGNIMPPHAPRSIRRQYIRVSCGHRLMAAVSKNRSVYVWGQLVHNKTKYLDGERLVTDFSVSQISCGLHHLAMMDADGYAYTWGKGDRGQRGLFSYSPDQEYRVTLVMEEPCLDVKCGPFSTFFLTAVRELKACGWNGDHHLGHISRFRSIDNMVPIPLKVSLFGIVSGLEILWNADYSATMIAKTSGTGVLDLYTWGAGSSLHPTYSDKDSFFEIFVSLKLTPGLINIHLIPPSEQLQLVNVKNQNRAKLVSDALAYIYLRDRPDLSREATRFLWKCRNHQLTYLVNLMPCEVSGKDFIITKFINDLRSKPQMYFDETDEYGYPVGSSYYST